MRDITLLGACILLFAGPIDAQTRPPAQSNASRRPLAQTGISNAHPLDPLTATEIALAVRVIRANPEIPRDGLLPMLALNEPPKNEVLAFTPGASFRREAFAVVFDRSSNRTFEVVVDLRARTVRSLKVLSGAQPLLTFDELERVETLVKADPSFGDAMHKRGITNIADVRIDAWAPGLLDPAREPRTVRWARALAFLQGKQTNPYARPIDGVVVLVNLTAMRVERVDDLGDEKIPAQSADLDERSVGKQRQAPRPLLTVQPSGRSFTVSGHEVRWQKWRFRFSTHPREGLVLHTVGIEDEGKVRPILYRASLSEMLVPYASPAGAWSFRNAFDEGEYGLGRYTDPLEVGTDAPPHARFFDAVFADDDGTTFTVERAVAIYERDGGLLWKHVDTSTEHNDSRRARELVVSSIVTIGNYDYGFNWIFRQDGTLELQAVLSGIMLAKGVAPAAMDRDSADADHFWHRVAPDVAAVHHQHFFNFRLDFDVDGTSNGVRELNTQALPPGAANPSLNAFTMTETSLVREQEAQRDVNLASARRWLIANPSARNALGEPTAYLIVPGDTALPYLQPDSPIRQRAGFINHHFWATPFAADERYAAGMYPNQSEAGEGLPAWTSGNRPLEGQDVVAWYTFGVTHVPRPEEWPVMSAATAGFKLMPSGFFSRNPALDVPRPRP